VWLKSFSFLKYLSQEYLIRQSAERQRQQTAWNGIRKTRFLKSEKAKYFQDNTSRFDSCPDGYADLNKKRDVRNIPFWTRETNESSTLAKQDYCKSNCNGKNDLFHNRVYLFYKLCLTYK